LRRLRPPPHPISVPSPSPQRTLLPPFPPPSFSRMAGVSVETAARVLPNVSSMTCGVERSVCEEREGPHVSRSEDRGPPLFFLPGRRCGCSTETRPDGAVPGCRRPGDEWKRSGRADSEGRRGRTRGGAGGQGRRRRRPAISAAPLYSTLSLCRAPRPPSSMRSLTLFRTRLWRPCTRSRRVVRPASTTREEGPVEGGEGEEREAWRRERVVRRLGEREREEKRRSAGGGELIWGRGHPHVQASHAGLASG
jgi:hypothetical protein